MGLNAIKNISIHIKGLVQGVGFRPFVYRTAVKYQISGWVKNQQDGVLVEATGIEHKLLSFITELQNNFPVAAQIQEFIVSDTVNFHKNDFLIVLSDDTSSEKELTQIGPDIAVCGDCLKDMKKQPHRLNYPFINCTNCGPRFSIIRNLPYDRKKTTMDVFKMCPVCKREYQNPADRRFHAQPVACLNCGPHYKFFSYEKETDILYEVLSLTAKLIDNGGIVAIKGIGGFFIACDATNNKVINRLRKLKNREGKPFAVMFSDVESVERFCFLNKDERKTLTSWQRPIVILKSKKLLPESVSNGISTVGAMLPYMPFHYLLFEKVKTDVLVFTSGNFSDEPIVISNEKARTRLSDICDAVVTYNREIYNRTDDSLIQVINNKQRLMRRSRGFAPNPIYLKWNVDGILACGAELKNTFCLGKGNQAILSQHIGDLKDFDTYSFYEKNIRQFQLMFQRNPTLIVSDWHPEYLSSIYAKGIDIELHKVQHHHAHIASAMAENNLDEKVIGVSFDGTGLGDDGNIWGSEFLVCDLIEYKRKLHFEYIPLPGGDLATNRPWRIALSWLYKVFGKEFMKMDLPFLKNISTERIEWLLKSVDNKINCPLSCGSGRLFDAVSAMLGICSVSSYEAEAPMRLESIVAENEAGIYSYKLAQTAQFSKMFREIVKDIVNKVSAEVISARFHNTVSEVIVEGIKRISRETGLKKVVLSGGTFQNKYLTERTENHLNDLGLEVFGNYSIPCNDGGIALGQLVIAAKKRSLKLL